MSNPGYDVLTALQNTLEAPEVCEGHLHAPRAAGAGPGLRTVVDLLP